MIPKNARVVISLCDLTGNAVKPWVEAGYHAFLVDPQHITTRTEGNVTKFAGTIADAMPVIGELIRTGNAAFIMPQPAVDMTLGAPDKEFIHHASPTKVKGERGNKRSITPMGFARAVFDANHRPALEVAA
jgi:hypothetical protein